MESPNYLSPVQETRFNGVSYAGSPKAFPSPRAESPRNVGGLSIATTLRTPKTPKTPKKEEPENITWLSLPHKGQLTILTLARLSEPITSTSLQSYLYHQLASFNPDDPGAVISTRTGFVLSAFPAAQAVTSVFWGRIADSPRFGRKTVLVVGLLGTAVGTVGYGMASSWRVAVFWRLVSGMLNGNVGVLRTMISEIVREKKYQSRAFLLLPMCFNIGTIIGPVLGGLLADPVGSYPSVFGPGSWLGGEDGVGWMKRWPYALPNFVSAIFLGAAAFGVLLGLNEVFFLPSRPSFHVLTCPSEDPRNPPAQAQHRHPPPAPPRLILPTTLPPLAFARLLLHLNRHPRYTLLSRPLRPRSRSCFRQQTAENPAQISSPQNAQRPPLPENVDPQRPHNLNLTFPPLTNSRHLPIPLVHLPLHPALHRPLDQQQSLLLLRRPRTPSLQRRCCNGHLRHHRHNPPTIPLPTRQHLPRHTEILPSEPCSFPARLRRYSLSCALTLYHPGPGSSVWARDVALSRGTAGFPCGGTHIRLAGINYISEQLLPPSERVGDYPRRCAERRVFG